MYTNIKFTDIINKHALEFTFFIFFTVLLILFIVFCIWKVFKICCSELQSQNEEEFEMHNIPRDNNVENALQENTSADAPEIMEDEIIYS